MHANATTTPEIRAYIRASDKPVGELAKELGVSRTTVRRWRGRTTADDSCSSKGQTSSLSEAEERLVYELRTRAKMSIDDITDVMCRCVNAQLSRSAIYRSLRRNGLNRVPHTGDVTANSLDQTVAANGLNQTDAGRAPIGLGDLLARPNDDSFCLVQPNRNSTTADAPSILRLALVDVRAIGGTSVIVGIVDPKSGAESVAQSLAGRLGDRTDETASYVPVHDSASERVAPQAGDSQVPPDLVADDDFTAPDPRDSNSLPEPNTPPPVQEIGTSVAERQGTRPQSMSSLGRYALTLWLAGAVAYVAGTQSFLRSIDVFKSGGAGPAVSIASVDNALQAASAKQAEGARSPTNEGGSASAVANANPAATGGEWVEISHSGVNMRAGPSSRFNVVTVQSLGTKLRVLSRDGRWTELIDPETGRKGWVFDRYTKQSPPP